MATSPFDIEQDDAALTDVIPPLWTLPDLNDNDAVLEWMNNCYEIEMRRIARYRMQALKHVALFRGRFYADNPGSGRGFAENSMNGLGSAPSRVSKLVVNHLYDLVVQRVSRITRNKPAVSINPANAEYGDRISAKVVKAWVDYELYQNDFDRLIAECAQSAFIMGEAYIATLWDSDAGEIHPDWKAEEEAAGRESRPPRLELLDDKGEPVISEAGDQLFIEKPVKTGDVRFKVLTPLNTIVEFCSDFHKANYFIHEAYVDIDELRAKYSHVGNDIESDEGTDGLDSWRDLAGVPGRLPGKVLVRYFYHQATPYLANGRFIASTASVILENKALPSRQQGLPLVRLTDIDIPGEQRGMSFFIHGKSINATINDLTSMARRNALLLAHPKWTVPRGSIIKKDALGNDITMIEYMGATPPRLEAPPPMSQEIGQLRENLKQDLQTILGVFDISRGQIPPNVRSALALQVIDEQEEQRANSGVAKHAALIRDTIKKAINIAAAYYKQDDKRLLPIVGRDNRYLLKEFNPSDLAKGYDIRVANTSGMPSSKAARTEMLVELRKTFGDKFVRDEQAADLLQWGDTDRYYDAATVAVKAAEAENEAILGEEGIEDPAPYENHVVHWSAHMREVQNRGFKTATPEHVQSAMVLHIMATEMLMIQSARKNPAYSLELVNLPQFPAFFDLSPMDRVLMDRARTGNPLTLVEMDQLYTTGMITPGSGAPPPPGGIPNPNGPAPQGPGAPGGQALVPPEEEVPGGPMEPSVEGDATQFG